MFLRHIDQNVSGGWGASYSNNIAVTYSDDGVTWSKSGIITSGHSDTDTTPKEYDISSFPATTRYLKFVSENFMGFGDLYFE
jgi:hypothetical protein